jgi:hypothetical protein
MIYAGCSGETCVYVCCITDRACICVKMCIFGSRMNKKGTSSMQRVMEGHPSKFAWSEKIFFVTFAIVGEK